MKLSYRCYSCKKESSIKTKAANRHELLIELGKNEINERCIHCGHFNKKHINRLNAEDNYSFVLIGFILAVIATIFMWDLGFVSTLTGAIPLYFWTEMKKKSSIFNRSMVK